MWPLKTGCPAQMMWQCEGGVYRSSCSPPQLSQIHVSRPDDIAIWYLCSRTKTQPVREASRSSWRCCQATANTRPFSPKLACTLLWRETQNLAEEWKKTVLTASPQAKLPFCTWLLPHEFTWGGYSCRSMKRRALKPRPAAAQSGVLC